MSQQKKKSHKAMWIIILIILIFFFICCIIIFVAGYIFIQKIAKPLPTESIPIESTLNNYYGYIEGSLGYPSDYIPAMSICAKNIKTKEEFCTYQLIEDSQYTYNIGYLLQVPSGTYNVYAQLIDEDTGSWLANPYRAYYSDYVVCDANIFDCTSHKPINILIEAGYTTSKVDPQDWYANI